METDRSKRLGLYGCCATPTTGLTWRDIPEQREHNRHKKTSECLLCIVSSQTDCCIIKSISALCKKGNLFWLPLRWHETRQDTASNQAAVALMHSDGNRYLHDSNLRVEWNSPQPEPTAARVFLNTCQAHLPRGGADVFERCAGHEWDAK